MFLLLFVFMGTQMDTAVIPMVSEEACTNAVTYLEHPELREEMLRGQIDDIIAVCVNPQDGDITYRGAGDPV